METQTRLNPHNKFISAEFDGIASQPQHMKAQHFS